MIDDCYLIHIDDGSKVVDTRTHLSSRAQNYLINRGDSDNINDLRFFRSDMFNHRLYQVAHTLINSHYQHILLINQQVFYFDF